MAPCDGSLRRANELAKEIKDSDLIGQRFMDGPARGGVRRPGKRKTIRQHIRAGNGVARVFCGIGTPRGDVTMAIQKHGAIPIYWNFDEISGPVWQGARVRADAGLRENGWQERE